VTSPPYWQQRNYTESNACEFGREKTLEAYAAKLALLFYELERLLADNGVLWLNIGDSFRNNRFIRVGSAVVDALENIGWVLRAEVIFERLNFTPRPSPKRPVLSYERVFMLTKSEGDYFYDENYMREPSKCAGYKYVRNGPRDDDGRLRMDGTTIVEDTRILRAVWTGSTGWGNNFKHPAMMPRLMAERCVLSVTRPGDLVLDPFSGSGTTGRIALAHGRRFEGWELNQTYARQSREHLSGVLGLFDGEA
jgi:DNA modification methylase